MLGTALKLEVKHVRGCGAAPRPGIHPSKQWRHKPVARDSSSSSSTPSPSSSQDGDVEKLVFLGSGDVVSMTSRQRKKELWPELIYSREDAIMRQLEALKNNNEPYVDHGVEVLYRFADFDPFNPRCKYFGRQFDLGQFERFRRIMHTPPYAPLLGHESAVMLSSLQVSERVFKQRVLIQTPDRGGEKEEKVYEFTMAQRLGGVYCGYWFTQSLVADDNDWGFMAGPQPGRFI